MSLERKNERLDDETLVAYVDGELEVDRRAAIDAVLAHDVDVRARVALMRASAISARGAFAEIVDESVPEHILAAAMGRSPAADPAPAPNVIAFRRPATFELRALLLPLAASALALFIGFGAGQLTQSGSDQTLRLASAPTADPAESAFMGALYRALEANVTGEPFTYRHAESGTAGTVVVTGDVAASLTPCREFRHERRAGVNAGVSRGIACRAPDGSWPLLAYPVVD
jgi:anti-sigma factor RsiW